MVVEWLLLAAALAMDCFAVSVVAGFIIRSSGGARLADAGTRRTMLTLAVLFGFFQALMPLIGWFLTSRFSAWLQAVDHWIAFGMLAFIGVRMIVDSFKPENAAFDPKSLKTQLLLAVATSIDAAAVGISFACTGYEKFSQLIVPLILIGIVSFLFSLIGFLLGLRFGDVVNKKVRPELIGGLILIAIGVHILIEHLGGTS